MSKNSCLGSLVKGTLILCTFPVSVPIIAVRSSKRNKMLSVLYPNVKNKGEFFRSNKKMIKENAESYMQNYMLCVSENLNIVETTKSPSRFFGAVRMLDEVFSESSAIKGFYGGMGYEQELSILKSFNENKHSYIVKFIDKYSESAKSSFAEFSAFLGCLSLEEKKYAETKLKK